MDRTLAVWRERALEVKAALSRVILGQESVIEHLLTAVFARGHVLLEGGVGVGKTTLLRALAKALGGAYERIEGTVDLLPSDLIYHTYLDEQGRPRVEPGPLLAQGEDLSVFFFNEINRARPQVHALLLRAMAERQVRAFQRDFRLPYLLVFADRNRIEREETFELPAAARDRFFMEIRMNAPEALDVREALAFNPRFYDPDRLLAEIPSGLLDFRQLEPIAYQIQEHIAASPALRRYVLDLWQASEQPARFGVTVEDLGEQNLVLAGASPRGVAALVRAARVRAFLAGREAVMPEDVQAVFPEVMRHRVFLQPVFEAERELWLPKLLAAILQCVPTPRR